MWDGSPSISMAHWLRERPMTLQRKLNQYTSRAVRFSGDTLTFIQIKEGFKQRTPAWKLAGLKEKPDA